MALCERRGLVIPILSEANIKEKIVQAVCALLNCDGGTVIVTDTTLQIRSIEQLIMKVLVVTSYHRYIKIKSEGSSQAKHNILIYVKTSGTFMTVNYNLYLPTEKQALLVPATDPIEVIQRVLQRSIIEDRVTQGSHLRTFVLGEDSGLSESAVCQLKNLKTEASSSNKKFADRMVSGNNKINHYISAFANNTGGHIYYGIDDKGVVRGEQLGQKDIEDATKKVSKVIKELIWTERRMTLERGVDWEIFFEKVKDANGDIDETTCVVVIFVAWCCGGVFTREPESYYIKEGKVVEVMEYDLWWKAFKAGAFSNVKRFIWSSQSNVKRIPWSSETNKNFFIKLSEKLVDHRDIGDFEAFDKLCKLAVQPEFKKRNAHLVVKAGEITIAYKSGKAINAGSLLKEFESLLGSSQDKTIFEVRLRLSQSLVARSVGNYEESYARSTDGLQLAQVIPPGLNLLWLYLECAMNAICLGSQNQGDFVYYNKKKSEALVYLDEAARVANTLAEENIPFRMIDFNHKRSIYKAWVLINYSVTGDAAEIAPTQEDLDTAVEELSSIFKNKFEGKLLTKFRDIEYHLVQCDYLTRSSELLEDSVQKRRTLEEALKLASIAEKLAEENTKYNNLFEYAKRRCKFLKDSLDSLDKLHNDCKQTFEGWEY